MLRFNGEKKNLKQGSYHECMRQTIINIYYSLRSACQYDDDKWQEIKPLRRQLDSPKDDTKQKVTNIAFKKMLMIMSNLET